MPAVPGRLLELARVFLRLGVISFGGPAAHIVLMRDELVARRRWLTDRDFLDLVSATNLIPGPNSTEIAIHIGLLRAGWRGLLVAGLSFILPAALIVGGLAVLYVQAGSLPAGQALLYGAKPVVVAVILVALWNLGRTAVRSAAHVLVAAVALAAIAAGVHELVVLLLAGVAGWTMAGRDGAPGGSRPSTPAVMVAPFAPVAAASAAVSGAAASLGTLGLVFLKAGALLFGSGYVLAAFLRADLVERLGWLSEQQLLDAITVGQFTPGPVFTTATFIGYLLAGPAGAVVATTAIFLPAFVFVALSGPLVPRLRASRRAGGALDGVNCASLALMAAVTWHLSRTAIVDVTTAVVAAAGLVAVVHWRINPAWVIAGGIVVGLVRLIVQGG